MAYIGKQPLVGNYQVLDALTATTTDTYALTKNSVAVFPQTPANCIVSLNGVIQAPYDSYTISGSNIVFASALTGSDSIDFITVLGDVLNVGTVSDGTIGIAKLSATGTKDATTFLRGDNTFATAGGTNTPNFLATMSATQTPTSSAQVLINFDQTTYDSASGYNTASKKYVIPSAGYYHIYTCVNLYNASNDLDRIILYINIGGSTRFSTDSQPLNAASDFVYLGGVYNCSANDDVEIKVYQVSGSGTGTIANDKSFFGGYKLIT